MATRSQRLNRLTTGFSCESSWDAMAGEGCRRHCAACDRAVLDFAQLTPRAAAAHLQASHGRLCGRLTRQGGRLVLAPIEPASPPGSRQSSSGPRRRFPAAAAALVSAWLAASAGSARAGATTLAEMVAGRGVGERAPEPRQANAAAPGALRGQIHDPAGEPLPDAAIVVGNTFGGTTYETTSLADGSFAFDDLPPGTYSLEATHEGFAVVEIADGITVRPGVRVNVEITAVPPANSVTMGIIVPAAEPMHRLFDESELVVIGVVGPSVVADSYDGYVNMATELRLETVFKGPAGLRLVSYRHQEYPDDESGATHLAPGTHVLAFLEPSDDGALEGRAPAYETVGYESVKLLSDAEVPAYSRRLEALQRIEARAARRGGDHDPEEMVDWLVGTIEDPLTRGEAMDEVRWAVDALAERAEASSQAPEQAAADLRDLVDRFRAEGGSMLAAPPSAVFGAFVGGSQRRRLTAALDATSGLREADRELFDLVYRWDEAKALAWLAAQLDGSVDDRDAERLRSWLPGVVEEIGDASLAPLVEEVHARQAEVEALWPDDHGDQTQALREARMRTVWERFRHERAAALARRL